MKRGVNHNTTETLLQCKMKVLNKIKKRGKRDSRLRLKGSSICGRWWMTLQPKQISNPKLEYFVDEHLRLVPQMFRNGNLLD